MYDGYKDTYYSRTLRENLVFPALDENLDVDTLVVGGGLAGCATALELAERGGHVALIESRRIGWGASGLNGGFASQSFPGELKDLVGRVGIARAKEMQSLSVLGHSLVRERIDRYQIACGPLSHGSMRLNIHGQSDDLRRIQEFMALNFGVNYDYLPCNEVRSMVFSEKYDDGLRIPDTFCLHPLNLTRGLARACVERGGAIFENTSAISLTRKSGYIEVLTPCGRIRAGSTVLACGAYVDGLQKQLSRATIPMATFLMVTEPLGDRLYDIMREPYAISDSRVAMNYYRVLEDTRLLWGGRALAWEPSPSRIAYLLKKDMISIFPCLRDVSIEVAWSGLMPFIRHELPVIGQLEPNVWFGTGFGELGVTFTSAAGRLLADGILGKSDAWRSFDAIGLPYAGGKIGAFAAQGVCWWREARASFGGHKRSV